MKKTIISLIIAVTLYTVMWADSGNLLLQAAKQGNTETMKLLIEEGVDVNFQDDEYNSTALMIAADMGFTEIVELLIDAGADIHLQDNEGWTALMCAVNEGNIEIVKLFNNSSAAVNIKNNEGNTALMMATSRGYTEIVELLQENRSAVDVIIGIWGIDVDIYLQTPEIKEQLEAMPEIEDMVREMFAAMTIEFTADEMIVEAMGESESMPYAVVSSTDDTIVIEIDGETETITIISDTQIEISIEGQVLVLIK